MFRILGIYFIFNLLLGCQQSPTSVMNESGNVFDHNTVLVDTRSLLNYESFHIEGSVHFQSDDFLIYPSSLSKKKILNPDLESLIKRLAVKGISPAVKVVLLGDKVDSVENLKIKWLFNQLEVERVQTQSFEVFRKTNKGRFQRPNEQNYWELKSSEAFQDEFIIKKADKCFVRFDKEKCL